VVKPGGEFYMLDFEGREDGAHGFLARLLHSSDRMKDNSESRVLSLMRQAGFADPKKTGRRRMLFGGVAYYRAGRSWQGVSACSWEFSPRMERNDHRSRKSGGLGYLG